MELLSYFIYLVIYTCSGNPRKAFFLGHHTSMHIHVVGMMDVHVPSQHSIPHLPYFQGWIQDFFKNEKIAVVKLLTFENRLAYVHTHSLLFGVVQTRSETFSLGCVYVQIQPWIPYEYSVLKTYMVGLFSEN